MKIYQARIYALDSNVPYVDSYYLDGEYHYTDDCTIARNLMIGKNEHITEEYGRPIFLSKGRIIVYKTLLGHVKDIQTGEVFPTIEMKSVESDKIFSSFVSNKQAKPVAYVLSKKKHRLYVKIERELEEIESKNFFKSVTEDKILREINWQRELIAEQERYQIQHCEQQQREESKNLSNRQYVKKIAQMRNNIKIN